MINFSKLRKFDTYRDVIGRLYWLLIPPVLLYLFLVIKEKKQPGDKSGVLTRRNRIAILLLDSERYRGDIDVLSSNLEFRIFYIEQKHLSKIQKLFINLNPFVVPDIVHDRLPKKEKIRNNYLLDFLKIELTILSFILKIRCVTTAHFKYIEDYHFTYVFQKIGVPYIALYRECNLYSKEIYSKSFRQMQGCVNFWGAHIIVHNDLTAKALRDSGFCTQDQVSTLGALRVDSLSVSYNKYLHKKSITPKKRRKFVLFYFPPASASFIFHERDGEDLHKIFWLNLNRLFIDLNSAILELAYENKDIDFVIKPKADFISSSLPPLYKIHNDFIGKFGELKNYNISPNEDVYKLIADSDIVCGMESSTSIESLLFGKEIIMPFFYDYVESDFFIESFPWKEQVKYFTVTYSKEEFKSIFYNKIKKSSNVNQNYDSARIDIFQNLFGKLDGGICKRYEEKIKDLVE